MASAPLQSTPGHELRLRALEQRIQRELSELHEITEGHRGTRRPVVCLTPVAPPTARFLVFRSITAAARLFSRHHERIRSAVMRGGNCAGHRWAYLDQLEGAIIEKRGDRFVVLRTHADFTAA